MGYGMPCKNENVGELETTAINNREKKNEP